MRAHSSLRKTLLDYKPGKRFFKRFTYISKGIEIIDNTNFPINALRERKSGLRFRKNLSKTQSSYREQ